MKKTMEQEEKIAIILSEINKIQNNSSDKEVGKILEHIRKTSFKSLSVILAFPFNFLVISCSLDDSPSKAIFQDVLKSLTPGQQVVKIVKDELVELLGGEDSKINFVPNPPTIIMLVGLLFFYYFKN